MTTMEAAFMTTECSQSSFELPEPPSLLPESRFAFDACLLGLHHEALDKTAHDAVGGEVKLIGGEVKLIGGEAELIGGEVKLIGGEMKLIGGEVKLIGGEVKLI